jgi:hypothetical protein
MDDKYNAFIARGLAMLTVYSLVFVVAVFVIQSAVLSAIIFIGSIFSTALYVSLYAEWRNSN